MKTFSSLSFVVLLGLMFSSSGFTMDSEEEGATGSGHKPYPKKTLASSLKELEKKLRDPFKEVVSRVTGLSTDVLTKENFQKGVLDEKLIEGLTPKTTQAKEEKPAPQQQPQPKQLPSGVTDPEVD